MHSPRVPHLRAALHLIKYLKGNLDNGLWYKQTQISQSQLIMTLIGTLANSAVNLLVPMLCFLARILSPKKLRSSQVLVNYLLKQNT